jgi:hypothetical protein
LVVHVSIVLALDRVALHGFGFGLP